MHTTSTESFFARYIHLFLLGGALIFSFLALVAVLKFDNSQLKAFGPTARVYFDGMKSGLFTATTILFIAFISSLILRKYLEKTENYLKFLFSSFSTIKKMV
ncbi:MAG: hypothetical protein Q7K40_02360 [bacterium]|nr:hypothetical protein [bacterium]